MIDQGWFQKQLNEEAIRLGKSATDRLAIEIPSIHPQVLKHFYEEVSIQMAANVISNRMLEYFATQLTYLLELTSGIPEEWGTMPNANYKDVDRKSLFDPETKEIKLSKIYEENEDELINATISFLKIELQNIMQQMALQQQAQSRVQPASNIQMP